MYPLSPTVTRILFIIIHLLQKSFVCLISLSQEKIDVIKNHITSGCSAPPPDRREKHSTRPHKTDTEVEQYIIEHTYKQISRRSHTTPETKIHIKSTFLHYLTKIKYINSILKNVREKIFLQNLK